MSWERPDDIPGEAEVSYSFGVFVKEAGAKNFTLVFKTRDDDYSFRCVMSTA